MKNPTSNWQMTLFRERRREKRRERERRMTHVDVVTDKNNRGQAEAEENKTAKARYILE